MDQVMEIRKKLSQDYLQTLSSDYELEEVLLFGSILTEDFHEASDVDIAVIGKGKLGLKKILDIELAFEELLGRQIDVVDMRDVQVDIFLKVHILNTGECLFATDKGSNLEQFIDEVDAYYRRNRHYFELRRRDVLC